MSDQQVRLEAVLDFLEQDKITLDQAAETVSKMKFPAAPHKSVWDQMVADGTGDLEPPEPDSFFAVSAAYASGKITREQYTVLAEAAASTSDGQS